MNRSSFFAITVFLLAHGVEAQELPPIPYYSWDACPFECCEYRDWKAEESINVLVNRDTDGRLAYKISKGEWVRAIGGVVITRRYGVSKVLKPFEAGYSADGKGPALRLKPGELLYTLHYEGEGQYLFWYKGKAYIDGVAGREPDKEPLDPELNTQTLSVPQYEWWVKIRNRRGQTGWSNAPEKFSNSDRCG